jgi:hypothetical protein
MRQLDAGIESVDSFLASRVGSPKDMEGPNKRNPFESSASVCEGNSYCCYTVFLKEIA